MTELQKESIALEMEFMSCLGNDFYSMYLKATETKLYAT